MSVLLTRPSPVFERKVARRSDWVARFVGMGVAFLPFLVPAGPGNTGLPDLAIAAAIVLAAMWVSREHIPLHLPYALGAGLLVTGGALGAWLALAPASVVFVLVQDVFLLVWAAVIALGWRDTRIISAGLHSWCVTACIYSVVMALAYIAGINVIAGVSPLDGVRAAYTFPDPNLAGNYLVVSFFMVRACRWPQHPVVRFVGCFFILLAAVFTGSNGALITLVVGLSAAVILKYLSRGEAVAAALMFGVLATGMTLALGFVLPRVDVASVQQRAAESIPLLRDSVGRSGHSGEQRATIAREGVRLWLRGDATGYGPSRTKATLHEIQAPYVKEAHNDYLATLLERGVVGSVGLIMLIGAIAVRCGRLSRSGLSPPVSTLVPCPWFLISIGLVMATAGLFYEVLHFRHLWTWLGLLAALELSQRHQEREARS